MENQKDQLQEMKEQVIQFYHVSPELKDYYGRDLGGEQINPIYTNVITEKCSPERLETVQGELEAQGIEFNVSYPSNVEKGGVLKGEVGFITAKKKTR